MHLPYFLSAWKLRCFPSCKGSSVPKNFSKAMTSFQDRTVYGGGEPGLIIGTGKGERGIWKSSTFPATASGAAQPQPSPQKGLQNPGLPSSWTSLPSFSGKVKAGVNLISQHFPIAMGAVVWRGSPSGGERWHSTTLAVARSRICQSHTQNPSRNPVSPR